MPLLLSIVFLFFFCWFCPRNMFSPLFSFISFHYLFSFSCSPPFLPCFLLSFKYMVLHFCLSPQPSDLPLSFQKLFLNSGVTSDPFHQPEKANYLPFYDFHYFTTHTVFYYWAVSSLHWHIPAHTHKVAQASVCTSTQAINNVEKRQTSLHAH